MAGYGSFGYGGVGGLVGYGEYCLISGSYFIGNLHGDVSVGGLVGMSQGGSISNCFSRGEISGDSTVGGLIGWNYFGNVVNCYSVGDVRGVDDVGGLAGWNNDGGSISNCYSSCDVNGFGGGSGFVAVNGSSSPLAGIHSGSVSNCFWDVDVQTHGVTVGIGENYGTVNNVAGLSKTEMQTRSTFTSAGWDFMGERANGTSETWQMAGDDGYPVLSLFHSEPPFPLEGKGTIEEPYLIGDANELGMINWYLGCLNVATVEIAHSEYIYGYSSEFKLTGDMDLSGINWSVAIVPAFTGGIDGDGHKLTNMRISGSDNLGFVGYLAKGGLSDLGVERCVVEGSGKNIGGLVGYHREGGTGGCYSDGYVSGVYHVGGLVGLSDAVQMYDCSSTGRVSGYNLVGGLAGYSKDSSIHTSCSTAQIRGNNSVGGLVGSQTAWDRDSEIMNCYSMGSVSGNRRVGGLVGSMIAGPKPGVPYPGPLPSYFDCGLAYCYSTGDVNGVEYAGGVVGSESRGGIGGCFFNIEIQTHGVTAGVGSGDPTGGVTRLTTEAMKTKTPYVLAGWDIDRPGRYWNLDCEGMNYPRLGWEVPAGDLACPHGVDSRDYSFLANRWMDADCAEADDCEGADIDLSGAVDWRDLAILFDSWLNGCL